MVELQTKLVGQFAWGSTLLVGKLLELYEYFKILSSCIRGK